MTDFAENLRKAREAKGISKSEAARFLGISLTAYSLYEKGEHEPPLKNLKKIANLLNVSIDALLNPNLKVEPTKELHIYLDFSYPFGLLVGTDFFATDMLIQKKRKKYSYHSTTFLLVEVCQYGLQAVCPQGRSYD